jgi:CheY-like chemotaxis protein
MDSLKGARVLLAEDNDMNQELAMELLGEAGIEVVLANNGQEALDILARDTRFDGLLMDCQMPVMDGYTATREIRKNPAFTDLPIIAMTANAMADDREKVIQAGMWDHIAKPLNVGQMFATLAKWIKPAATLAGPQGAGAMDSVVAHAELSEATALVPLPGIDVKAGLATSMNNHKLYVRMLLKFRDSQGQFADLFAAAQAQADPTAPMRAAHTLRGTAGSIGAKAVQAAAQALELACNEQAPAQQVTKLLEKVLAELAPVIVGLQQISEGTLATGGGRATGALALAPGNAAVQTRVPMDAAQLQQGVARLKILLEESDSKAGDLVRELVDAATGSPLEAELKLAAKSIADFDFDAALELLSEE